VWRLCAALVDRQAADDLAQETFVRAARSVSAFRGQANPRLWIFAIARNTCMDELRRRHRTRRRQEQMTAIAGTAAHSADPAGEVAANELLAHLEGDRRAAFVLTQLFRFSYQEAATVCDCPAGTIRSRVARAREDLIALLADDSASTGGRPDHSIQ
jgi:RNA polymerase sigma-70 factor (ECF subfamily)